MEVIKKEKKQEEEQEQAQESKQAQIDPAIIEELMKNYREPSD